MHKFAIEVVHRQRDHAIISSVLSAVPKIKSRIDPISLKALETLALTSYEAAWLVGGQDWDLPVVYGMRDETAERMYADPVESGQSLGVGESLISEWAPHARGLLNGFLSPQGQLCQPILNLYRCMDKYVTNHDSRDTQKFIARLWKHRWVMDSVFCSRMLLAAGVANGDINLSDAESVAAEAHRGLQKSSQLLEKSRDSVQNLDEWFEELYLLMPWLRYTWLLFKLIKSEDANKQVRCLDEMIVDTKTVWSTGIQMILGGLPTNPHYWSWNDETSASHTVQEKSLEKMIRELVRRGEGAVVTHEEWDEVVRQESDRLVLRRLSYGYSGRIMFPRFWCDAISDHLRSNVALMDQIGVFSRQRLVSIYITDSPMGAAAVLSGGLDEMFEKARQRNLGISGTGRFNTQTGQID